MTDEAKPQPKTDAAELDPNSLAAIRSLLAGEDETAPSPEAKPVQATAAHSAAPAKEAKRDRLSPLAPQAQVDAAPGKTVKPPRPKGETMFGMIKAKVTARVRGYRPKPKHIILVSLALLVFFRPWLVIGLLFLFAFVLAAVFLILGYDGFWRRVMQVSRWYARKHPSRSVELHRKLDNFAMRFDAFLDRFPEGSVDGLYLPDFGDLAEADARHGEALDRRFENLRETKA